MASPRTGDTEPLEPDAVARHEFASAFRGFDQIEVRAFLGRIGTDLRRRAEREADLARRLDDAERRLVEAEHIDETRLTALLGEETARILDAARSAAGEIRAKAEAKVGQLLRESQDEAARLTAEAERILRERSEEAEAYETEVRTRTDREREALLTEATARADALRIDAERAAEAARAEAEQIRAEATAEADEIREAARAGAEQLRAEATADAAAELEESRRLGREMVAEAQTVRERVLRDLARRRRAGKAQLEQLRAARERLLDAYAVVRRTIDEATSELSLAVPEAKLAAEAAGRRAEADADLSVEAIEAELDAARVAGIPLLDTGEVPVVGPGELTTGSSDGDGPDVDGPDVEVSPVAAPGAGAAVPADPADPADSAGSVESVEPGSGLASAVVDDPAEPVGEAQAPETDPATGSGGDDPVEDLFARLRADADEPGDLDEPAAAEDDGEEAASPADADLDLDLDPDADPDADPDPDVDPDAAPDVDPDSDSDREVVLEQRDAVTEPLERDLARGLKRLLADDENERLDRLRRQRRAVDVDEVLGDPAEQRVPLLEAAAEVLARAAASGVELGVGLGAPGGPTPAVDDLVARTVDELVAPLRARLTAAMAGTEGDEAVDAVRACYREWRTTRIGEVVGEVVHTACNRGILASTGPGDPVRWVLDIASGPCPDGEDDALGGTVRSGEPFPTGHLHPPAHPGCRCLLVPDRR